MQRLHFLKSAEHVTDGLDPSLLPSNNLPTKVTNPTDACKRHAFLMWKKGNFDYNGRLKWSSDAEHGEILGVILGGTEAGLQRLSTFNVQRSLKVMPTHGLPTYLLLILAAPPHHITSHHFSFTNSHLSRAPYYWISLTDLQTTLRYNCVIV